MSETNRQGNDVRGGCPEAESVVGYVRGEVSGEELSRFERHLSECDACRERVSEIRAVVARLRQLEPEPLSRDLAPDVLARIPRPAPPALHVARIAVLAACLLLILWGGWTLRDSLRTAEPEGMIANEVTLALDWLASAQEADGSWDPGKWGGQSNYRTALTGLALLAFVNADGTPAEARYREAVERAAAYLVSRQSTKSGRFGPFFSGAPYNHGIATVALLETYARTRDADLRTPLARAVHFIKARQDERGGWGYLSREVRTNTSITAWQLHALLLADSLGWSDSNRSAEKGLSWLEGVVGPDGLAGYTRSGDFPYGSKTLTAMTAFCFCVGTRRQLTRAELPAKTMDALLRLASQPTGELDYYQSYFVTHALSAARGKVPEESSELDPLATQLRDALIKRQVKTGPNSGSWEPSDRWGRAGGRVYATAMAALSLEADARADTLAPRTKTSQ